MSINDVTDAYVLDLTKRAPEVLFYDAETILEDLMEHGARSIADLSDYDWRIFKTEQDAKDYLERYMDVLKGLNNAKICKSRSLPALLYKRRYLVQTLLGDKLQTYRHYDKRWKPGQLFNLNDQTYFLTVKLTSLTLEPQGFCYRFELL